MDTRQLHTIFLVIVITITTTLKTTAQTDITTFYDTALAPFYHGVASGDPLPNQVIIWTKVTPASEEPIEVVWKMATTEDFSGKVQTGKIKTDQSKNFTVKVDVRGLTPDTYYYYQFSYGKRKSIIGRTRTAPDKATDQLKFIIASCSNYEAGYFNAYGNIAKKENVNAVLHLGDYIYEYGPGTYGDTTLNRKHLPPNEIITLEDYRTRYSIYRLDKDLRNAHRMHPFITIWDDHEVANDSYETGGENHQPDKEGSFADRKKAARQAYFEWLPVRENSGRKIHRKLSFGPLADLIMLDERLEGRSPQVDSLKHPDYMDETRSMLGAKQLTWFTQSLSDSKATWKIIGNQVIFADLNISPIFPQNPLNMDAWDGYPVEKKKILEHMQSENIENILFVTGDTHCSWAFEVPFSSESYKNNNMNTLAVELGTPSITSANYDYYTTLDTVKMVEQLFQDPRLNPHLKYVNLHEHGYIQLTLSPEAVLSEWYYVESIDKENMVEKLAKRLRVPLGEVRLVELEK